MRASLPCPWAGGPRRSRATRTEKKQACAGGVAPGMVFTASVSWKDKPLQRFRWQFHLAFATPKVFSTTRRERHSREKVHWRGKTSTGPFLPARRARTDLFGSACCQAAPLPHLLRGPANNDQVPSSPPGGSARAKKRSKVPGGPFTPAPARAGKKFRWAPLPAASRPVPSPRWACYTLLHRCHEGTLRGRGSTWDQD